MFNLLKMYLKSLPKTKKGQAMVEYGLIIALIAVVVITVVGLIGTNLRDNIFNKISNALK
jgi:pilus assembly protein Flp/PilA